MSQANFNSRVEAFCDGVFAIAITLLVIDIKIPSTLEINTNAELWNAIKDITPSILAFLLSFIIILITWVNHHNHLKMVHRSSSAFLYANGSLLLTVAFLPFPTSLLGEYLFTNHATPAVVLYDSVLSLQAIGWILISVTAIKGKLAKNEKAEKEIQKNGQFGYFAFTLYATCSIIAFWFPFGIAVFTTLTWIFWLLFGIKIKFEEFG